MAGIASDEAAAMKKGLEAASQEAPAGLPKGLHNLKVVIPPPPKPAKVDKVSTYMNIFLCLCFDLDPCVYCRKKD